MLYLKNHKTLFHDKEPEKLRFLTVTIPAYNEEKHIADTIRAIQSVDYPKELMEIIVINDGSTDNTLKEIKKFNGITIINKKNTGKADSMNQALKIARGEFFVTTDADSFPNRDAFSKMVGYFNDPGVGAVTGAIISKDSSKLFVKMQSIEYFIMAFARKLFDYVDSVHVTPGPLSMYRTEVIRKLGGFDTSNITEDIEIGWKLMKHGYKNRMCLSARVYTNVPIKLKSWWNQRLRWNIGGFQTLYKYRKVLFNVKESTLGLFVAPRFLIAYVLSIIGFFIFLYLIAARIKAEIISATMAAGSGVPQLALHELNITPTVFTFFIILFLIFTLAYTITGLRTMNKGKLGVRGHIVTVFAYLLLYLVLFPPVLLHSIYIMATKGVRWYK